MYIEDKLDLVRGVLDKGLLWFYSIDCKWGNLGGKLLAKKLIALD